MMGTPAYMAPEQVKGGEIDSRTDLYSAGVVLYFLATAKLPFKGDTPMAMAQSRILDLPTPILAVRPDLPAWLAQVTGRARTTSVGAIKLPEMREALRRGPRGARHRLTSRHDAAGPGEDIDDQPGRHHPDRTAARGL
jgi:serine/threonine-protein kinase